MKLPRIHIILLPTFLSIYTLFVMNQILYKSRETFPFAAYFLYPTTPSLEIYPTIFVTELNNVKTKEPLDIFQNPHLSRIPLNHVKHALAPLKWRERGESVTQQDIDELYEYVNKNILQNDVTEFYYAVEYFYPYEKLKHNKTIKTKRVSGLVSR